MSLLTKTAVNVFDPVDAAGAPRSVLNHDAQVWGTEVEAVAAAKLAGAVTFGTKAEADLALAYDAWTTAWIIADPVTANNGWYTKFGASGSGSWVRKGDLPYSYIKATNAGAGTANAIVATTASPIPAADGGALIALPIAADTTASPVTVAFNGDTALTIKNVDGEAPNAGDIRSGMILAGYKSGTTFRSICDVSSLANREAAEAAQVAAQAAQAGAETAEANAEAARDIAAGYASDAVSQGNVPIYATIDGMSAITVPVGINAVRVNGRAAAGDGEGGLFIDTDNGSLDTFISQDGRTWYRSPARNTLAAVVKKALDGNAITIACYGDSITYGQDQTPSGGEPPINGASTTRSPTPYPESLAHALNYARFPVLPTVINRGFPGDTTVQGLSRWASVSATDVAIIMYGHNDANSYGGAPVISVEQYELNLTKIVQREIRKGAAVIVLLPPRIRWREEDDRLRSYALAARRVAEDLDVTCIDAAEQLSSLSDYWLEGVHLKPFAYNELGYHLAALFFTRNGGEYRVAPGSYFYASDGVGINGALLADPDARTGYLMPLAPGETFSVGVYCESDVTPVIGSFNTGEDSTGPLITFYGGGEPRSGVAPSNLTHAPARGPRQALTGPTLRRGYRVLVVGNQGTETAYIENVSFEGPGRSSTVMGLLKTAPGLSGLFSPRRLLAAQTSWWGAADYSERLSHPYRFVARVTLSGSGITGLGVFRNRQNSPELLSTTLLAIWRNGTSLVIRELQNGAPVGSDTTVADVFPASVDWTGEIDVDLGGNRTLNVYVDGVLKGTRALLTITDGFPGLLCAKAQSVVCHGAWIAGAVKDL